MDGVEDSAALAERLHLNFPILSDPDLSVIRAYGVAMKGQDLAVPATFVIGRDRRIHYKYVGDAKSDRPAVDQVLIQVDEVR